MKVELRVLGGEFEITMIALIESKYLVGRAADCHLRPGSDRVSRHHCVFKKDDFSVRIRDLGSTNGTFVNNERIQGEVLLNHGDIVQVGDVTMQVFCPETAQATADTAVVASHDTTDGSKSGTNVYEADTTIYKTENQPANEPPKTEELPAGDRPPTGADE